MKIFGDNLLAFLDAFTTVAEDDSGTASTMTIANVRNACYAWFAIGVVAGPWVHRTMGFKPLF